MTTNTEHLVSYLKAIDAHDLDSVRNAYADDVAIRAPGTELDGRDAAAAWMDAFVRAFPDLRHEILSTAEADDTVALEARFTATHTGPLASPDGDIPPTGKAVDLVYADVLRFASGRIRSEHVYFDQLGFLTQLGLMPG